MQTIENEEHVTDGRTIRAQRKLVERVIASPAFGRAERLSSLLSYICEQTFQGNARDLHEQHIGEAVFGRVKGYDCSIDGIVRTHASRLRQKLAAYFENEGTFETIRITVPTGGYVPVFELRSPNPLLTETLLPSAVLEEITPHISSPQPIPSAGGRSTSFLVVYGLSLLAIGALLAILLLLGFRHRGTTDTNPLWGKLLASGSPTLIVPGDSSLVIWQGMMNREPSLSEYMKQSYLDSTSPDATTRLAANIGSRRYTSTVDLNIVKALSAVAQQQSGSLNVRYARDIRPNDLKHGNVILIGAAEATPWVRLFEPNMNFVLSLQRENQRVVVINRKPQASEPAEWIPTGNGSGKAPVFSLAAYLPNLDGEGNVLILEGDTMAGTECAWDFVSDNARFLPFLKSIRSHGDGPIPHFEVLLSTQNTGGSAARGTVLAFRTYP